MIGNLERAKEILNSADLNGLVAVSPENVLYFSGFWSNNAILRERFTICAFFQDEDPILITAAQDEAWAKSLTWVKDVKAFTEFPRDSGRTYFRSPVEALHRGLEERNLGKASLGIEGTYIPTLFEERLGKELPNVKFEPADRVYKKIRLIKTQEEIRRIEKAAQITLASYTRVREYARPGVSEIDLAVEMRTEMMRKGADEIKFLCLGAGSRAQMVHNRPTENKVREDDIIHLDVGITSEGYCSDFAAAIAVGEASKEVMETYSTMQAAESAAIEAVRPGIPASEVFQASIKKAQETMPNYSREFIGHGIGLEVHEIPVIRPQDNTPFEEGMVLNLEQRPYSEGILGGIHIEDTLIVSKDGCRVLTYPPREL